MGNEETPCAAALYSESHEILGGTTYFLSSLIGNAGDKCRGAGTAILCHLIRNSKNRVGEFKPLRIGTDFVSKSYYQSFGCTGRLDTVICNDPKPTECERYVDKYFDAGSYFQSVLGEDTTSGSILADMPPQVLDPNSDFWNIS